MKLQLRNSDTNYGAVTKGFHWLMALLIIGMLVLGHVMQGMHGLDKIKTYGLHKSTGVLILFLVFLRFSWRQVSYQPPLTPTQPSPLKGEGLRRGMELAANISHSLVYVLMFLMPVTGWLMSSAIGFPVSFFGLFALPNLVAPSRELGELLENLHGLLSWALIGLLCAHIGAAMFHHFYLKDNVLKRMLPVVLLAIMFSNAAYSVTPEYKIDKAKSSLKFEAVENGAKVGGEFKDFNGTIVFKPDDLAGSKVDAQVTIGSVTSSYDEMSSTLQGDEWFAVKKFPMASFKSTDFKKTGDGYVANGKLTIRDKTMDVPVKFKLVSYDTKRAVIDGSATFSRNAFGVGQGEWKDTGTVKDEVVVRLHVEAVGL